jgi:hypothetical protein
MTETTATSGGAWSLGGLKDALLGGNKDKVSEEERTQATVNAALREETKLKEERGEETSGWRQKVSKALTVINAGCVYMIIIRLADAINLDERNDGR